MNTLELLERAKNEIQSLRSQNALMSARLAVFDDMMMMLKSPACYPAHGGVHPDIAFEIGKAIEVERNKIDKEGN